MADILGLKLFNLKIRSADFPSSMELVVDALGVVLVSFPSVVDFVVD